MEVPIYHTSPETDLQRALVNRGFTGWYTFQNESGFYPALGFELMLHTYPTYIASNLFIQETWIPDIVGPLKEIEDLHGDDRYSKPEYWAGLRDRCKEICMLIFERKELVKGWVAALRMFKPDEVGYLEDIVKYFRICLLLHLVVNGRPMTRQYVLGNQNQVMYYVNLAYEDGKVMALIHEDMAWGEVANPGFPNYLVIGSKEGKQPVILTPDENREAPPQDPTVIVKSLVTMTTLMSQIVLAGMPVVPHSQRETMDKLKVLHREMLPIVRRQFPNCSLDGDELTRVLALQVEAEVKERVPHTIETCSLYPEVQDQLLTLHTHSVHAQCLRGYLEVQFQGREFPLKCPISGCALPISDEMVSQFPDLHNMLKLEKHRTVTAATMTLTCGCGNLVSPTQVCELTHMCKLCLHCYMQSWESHKCGKCNRDLNTGDYEIMTNFYYRMHAERTSASVPQ